MSRIKTIVNLIDPVTTLLDIGTDHGHVIIESFLQDKIKQAIAVDINEGPLKSAYENIKLKNLHHKTTFLQTDGFLNVNKDYQGVVITGLGYKTIEHILKMDHKTPNYYILGAQSQLYELRLFLSNNNYKIIDEDIFYNKKDYIFIKVVKGTQKLDEISLLLGPVLMTKPKAINYYKNQLNNNLKILNKTNKDQDLNLENQIKIYKKIIKQLS